MEKRKLLSVVTVLMLCALLVAGSFAWTNFNSSIINNWFGSGLIPPDEGPGGTLHDDHVKNGEYKDVYVENWGEEPLFVRIKLSEYMETGEGAGITEGSPGVNNAVSIDNDLNKSIDDFTTWAPHASKPGGSEYANPEGDIYHEYWKWTMGGQKYYFPAPSDLRGTQDPVTGFDYVDSSSPAFMEPSDMERAKQTLSAQALTISDWAGMGGPIGNYWVLDTDGYAYWAAPLLPGDATGLLIHKVELVKQPADDYFYGIFVNAQMATKDGEPDNYEVFFEDATEQGIALINKIVAALESMPQPTGPLPTQNPDQTPAQAASPTPTPDGPAEPTGLLIGKVVSANTNDGIGNVHINAQSVNGGSYTVSAVTESAEGEEGSFELSLPPGEYILEIIPPGPYLSTEMTAEVVSGNTVYLEPIRLSEASTGDPVTSSAGGKITNAVDGEPIGNVALKFRLGMNTTTGDYVTDDSGRDVAVASNNNGVYSVTGLPLGNYTVEASYEGFVTGYHNIVVVSPAETTQNFTLTPIIPEGQTRIVLTWGDTPKDLDSHLTGPIGGSDDRFHVYFNSRQPANANADLDVDNITGFGPETITIRQQIDGVYRYSIHDYTNRYNLESKAMSLSGATVRVYRGDALVQTFNVPIDRVGTLWTVFEMEGNEIRPVNTILNHTDPGTVRAMSVADDFHVIMGIMKEK